MIQFLNSRAVALITCALAGAVACSRRSQTTAEPVPAAPQARAPAETPSPTLHVPESRPDLLAVDSAGKTATLTLETTSKAGSPSALINGSRNGETRIIVPVGWTVKWNWRNADTTSHSLVVMVQREKVPLEGGRASLTNAMSRMVTEGLPPEQSDQTTFLAEDAGWYWLMCGVPSHALAGEWVEFRVDPDATTASVEMKNVKH
jgi:uncharacterized cupredoxin-like copper-binding protein